MKYIADGSKVVVSLERGDSLVASLTTVARDSDLKSATVSGIGSVTDATLGFFDLDSRTYLERRFPDTYELVSCVGNITTREGQPFVHIHAAISGRDYRTYSGHLFQATIAVVGEFILWPLSADIHRTFDRSIGLAVWSFQDCKITSA